MNPPVAQHSPALAIAPTRRPCDAPDPGAPGLANLLALVAELEGAARAEGQAIASLPAMPNLHAARAHADHAHKLLTRQLARVCRVSSPAGAATLDALCTRMLTLETAARAAAGAAPRGTHPGTLARELDDARYALVADLATVCTSSTATASEVAA